jgi:hypothetical protein
MAGAAEKADPKLWDRVKKEVTGSEKGGRKGQWSARKAQLAVSEYKKKGGGYKDAKKADNRLSQWTEEDWGTKSGRTSRSTGERYLPRKAREKLSDAEYSRTTAKKRKDTAKGEQFSRQPADVAKKSAGARKTGGTAAATRRPAAKAATARKAAATRRTTTARRAASAKPTARKTAATRKTTARKSAPARTGARKPAARTATARTATARTATARKAATGRTASAKGGARKAAARKPAAKRTTAARRAPARRTAAARGKEGGSKR